MDETMVLTKRVGAILREAREAKKLTIRDVARDTNMIPRYIEALENEEYSQFPGETYALGFLRSYSDYLQEDTDHLLNLYRGHQIDQSQTPLKELTRPTGFLPALNKNVVLALAGVALVTGIISLFVMDIVKLPEWKSSTQPTEVFCKGRAIKTVAVPRMGLPPQIESLNNKNSLKFSFDDLQIKLCLLRVRRSADQAPVGVFGMLINEENQQKFEAREQQSVVLGAEIKELAALKYKLHVTPRVLADVSAKVQLEYDGAGAPPTDDVIRVTLQFIEDSYIVWTDDGNTHTGKTIPAGETRMIEAKNRLEIKLGNGGGVKVGRGNDLKIAGPPSKIVKFVFKRVPDPLDRTKFKIEESKEVVQ